jgi:hypothetical protein
LIMAGQPNMEFGRRRPAAIQTAAPVKRSSHVALLLMGTFAIGGGAWLYAKGELRDPAGDGSAVGAPNQRRMPAARIFIQRRPRLVGRVVAQQLLQQRFLVKPFAVRHFVRFRFGRRHARRFRLVRARVHVAFFRRRLTNRRRAAL